MDAWEILYDNSTLVTGDAWEHLNNQEGGTISGETLVHADGITMSLDTAELAVSISSSELLIGVESDAVIANISSDTIEAYIASDIIDVSIESDNLAIESCGIPIIGGEDEVIMVKVAAHDVSAYRMITTNAVGAIYYADKDAILEGNRVVGMTLQAAVTGGNCNIAISDSEVVNSGWNWDTSGVIYLGDDGKLTQVPPTAGFVLIVAVPLTPTTVRVRVDTPIFL